MISVVESPGSPKFDKARSICVDSLFFNEDGTIQKVTPTLRGVGVTNASQKIELDRYSHKSDTGVSIAFLDTLNTSKGWKSILDQTNAWIRYNAVDFGGEKYKSVQVKASSQKGSILRIHLDRTDGPLLSEVKIPEGKEWEIVHSPLSEFQPGIHDLVVVLKDNNSIEIDWIRFVK